jgi:SAM-dependent methyltransferase
LTPPAGRAKRARVEDLVRRTVAHYAASADAFWEATRDHDVRQNLDALLGAIAGTPPYRILDLGCGPGRDLLALRARGHEPVGLDAVPEFVAMARRQAGCPVLQQDFLALALPAASFDGVFANASLFHVPSRALPRVLGELRAALRPHGVLFASNPHGQDQEGFHGGRYGVFHAPESWRRFGAAAGFAEVTHYYRPAGRPRHQQPWLATVWRRTEA